MARRPGRVMVGVRISPAGITAMGELAKHRHEPIVDTHRAMLAYALQHMPKDWKPGPSG